MRPVLDEMRLGFRSLLKRPGFSLFVIATLALGIGANSAVFSLVNAVFLEPLPYADSHRLMVLWEDSSHIGFPRNTPAPANFGDWREQNSSFESMAALFGSTFNVTGLGEPLSLEGRNVTRSLFQVLGVEPMLGRVFTREEDEQLADVAIISYGLWQSLLGGDRNAIGRSVEIDGRQTEIVGVMPAGFHFPKPEAEIWRPSGLNAERLANRRDHFLNVIGRLKSGTSRRQAQSDMEIIARRLGETYPGTNEGIGVVVEPLRDLYVSGLRLGFLVLSAAVGLVLVIACANVANLMLLRAAGRRRELAVRAALGAGSGRILRHLLGESLLLALAGSIAGLFAGLFSFGFLSSLIPPGFVGADRLSIDWKVLSYTLSVAVIAGLAFALAPAWRSRRANLAQILASSGRGGDSGRRRRLQDGLVVAQMAIAVTLLIGAGLFIRTLDRLSGVELGFQPQGLLTMHFDPPRARYADDAVRNAFYRDVVEGVQALPGVESAGLTSILPLTLKGGSVGFLIEGQPEPLPSQRPTAALRFVSPGYLKTMGITLLQGRGLAPRDRLDSPRAAIINRTMAQNWPQGQAVGKRFWIRDVWITVVGVSQDVLQMGLDKPARAEFYMNYQQHEGHGFFIPREMAVRLADEPMEAYESVKAVIRSIDPDLPITRVRPMSEIVDAELAGQRGQTRLLAAFAALALVLAAVGIYGVLSYSVSMRKREIGIRMAMGGRPRDMLAMVGRQALAMAVLGISIGVAVSLLAGRWTSSLLFQVEAYDPLSLGIAVSLLLAIATLASLGPVRRAARVDALHSLRDE